MRQTWLSKSAHLLTASTFLFSCEKVPLEKRQKSKDLSQFYNKKQWIAEMKVCFNYKNKKVSKNIVTIGKKMAINRKGFWWFFLKKFFFDKLEVKIGRVRKLHIRLCRLVGSSSFRTCLRFLRRFARTHLIEA